MAGTSFFSGMAPGLAAGIGKIADESASAKGYALGAAARKDLLDSNKILQDTQFGAEDRKRAHTGVDMNIAGRHGVDMRYVNALRTGGDTSAFQVDPKINQAVLRDLGAFMQAKPTDVSAYHTATAELGGKQVNSDLAVSAAELLRQGKLTPDAANLYSAVRSPAQISQPNEVQINNQLNGMNPQQQRQLMGVVNAMRPQMPYSGDPTSGVINRGTGQVVSPAQPKPEGPPKSVSEAVARKMWNKEQAGAQPVPAGPAPAPAAPPKEMVARMKEGQTISDGSRRFKKQGGQLVEVK